MARKTLITMLTITFVIILFMLYISAKGHHEFNNMSSLSNTHELEENLYSIPKEYDQVYNSLSEELGIMTPIEYTQAYYSLSKEFRNIECLKTPKEYLETYNHIIELNKQKLMMDKKIEDLEGLIDILRKDSL